MILWCVLFCFVWGVVVLVVAVIFFFHCFALENFGKSVDEKYDLVVFLSCISRVSKCCSIPS